MPFQSKAQRRKFYALKDQGKMTQAEIDRWESETPSKIPERKRRLPRKKDHDEIGVTNGLAGCYMPDNVSGPIVLATRRELVAAIKAEIERYEWPANALAQIKVKALWAHIKRHGSSTAHFSIERGGYEIAFHGLTADEAAQMDRDNLIAKAKGRSRAPSLWQAKGVTP